jgi:hypothetical protein
VTYAFLTDGLTPEGKAKIDGILAGATNDKRAQAQREREAIAMIARLGGG